MSSFGVALLEMPEMVKLVKRLCDKHGIPMQALEELVGVELEQQGKKRKRGISEGIEAILDSHFPEDK